jgi:hypothetical protein
MNEKEIVQEAKKRSHEVIQRAGLGSKVKGCWPME